MSLRQEQQNKILVMNGEVQDDQKLIESLRVKCSTVRVACFLLLLLLLFGSEEGHK